MGSYYPSGETQRQMKDDAKDKFRINPSRGIHNDTDRYEEALNFLIQKCGGFCSVLMNGTGPKSRWRWQLVFEIEEAQRIVYQNWAEKTIRLEKRLPQCFVMDNPQQPKGEGRA